MIESLPQVRRTGVQGLCLTPQAVKLLCQLETLSGPQIGAARAEQGPGQCVRRVLPYRDGFALPATAQTGPTLPPVFCGATTRMRRAAAAIRSLRVTAA